MNLKASNLNNVIVNSHLVDATSEIIAAAYAIEAADEAGYGLNDDELSAHLEILSIARCWRDF